MTGRPSPAGVDPLREDDLGLHPADPRPKRTRPPCPGLHSPSVEGAGARAAELVLRFDRDRTDHRDAEVMIADAAGRILQRLGPFSEDEVVAVWRSLGAASGLPLAVESPDGVRCRPYPQIGRVQLGAIRIRRRAGLPNGRRPRFLARRKTARLPMRPQVHQEREMFAGGVL